MRLALKSFGRLAGTLVSLKLVEALDVLGAEEAAPSDEPLERKREPKLPGGAERVSPAMQVPALPKNLILYGPPGTGKTWEVLEKIRPHFGERAEMITFHPNFAYEGFVEDSARSLTKP